ncbi:Negative regulator of sporulation MDS3 [Candida viswanathii]|uniref:Negative regulator of sporulation MDS3 n=1 Tax=Candida viswanathii TaxID=5486 RepID=A0A367XXB2_9ASCO|nr:Negative regulator of sporulation MDS3 [Candida viswanathii]
MATLIPTASACFSLQLPPTEKDDRLNLNVRTGSASTLYNSMVFTHGGLTIGLELLHHTIQEINEIFYNRVNISNSKFKSYDRYLSGELFYLNLIERSWFRAIVDENSPRPKPRILHQICSLHNCIYLFGGLALPDNAPTSEDQPHENVSLVPLNDLWEFDLEGMTWTLLDDGSNYELDDAVPIPRFNHKMTVVSSLAFVNKKNHFGIFIAGGKDRNSEPIYDNVLFDLVEKRYVGSQPFPLVATTGNSLKDEESGLSAFVTSDQHLLNIDNNTSSIVNFVEEFETQKPVKDKDGSATTNRHLESIIVYDSTKVNQQLGHNPLLSFKVGKKQMKNGKPLLLHRSETTQKKASVVPYNLSYPTGGLFGQNIVITGFLPDEYDISIFVYNKPTGKWSRLNIFCSHDYGSHRFWGGFAWQSHHKVVLIGNNLTSKTTSSVRFFTVMLTVSLPITNLLVSSELSSGHYHHDRDGNIVYHDDPSLRKNVSLPLQAPERNNTSSPTSSNQEYLTDSSSDITPEDLPKPPMAKLDDAVGKTRKKSVTSLGSDQSPTAVSFSDYVHYAAPKTTFTTIRSVFPPEAVTLGRNAFDRYGDLLSDFEMVSCNGDRIPVASAVLMERWGRFFIQLLARGYVNAVDKFENDQALGLREGQRLRSKASNSSSSGSSEVPQLKLSLSESSSPPSDDADHKKDKIRISVENKPSKDAPHFRLPFQNCTDSTPGEESPKERGLGNSISSAVDPHQVMPRKNSVSSFQSNASSLLTSHLQDIPPQLPLPEEQIPNVPAAPASYRSTSRRNSQDPSSPRSSLIHTLTALRNIPISRSPRDSPFSSPRPSISGPGGNGNNSNNSNRDAANTNSGELFSAPFPNLQPNFGKPPNMPPPASSTTSSSGVPPSGLRKKSFDLIDRGGEDKFDSFSSGTSSLTRLSSTAEDHRFSDDGSVSPPEYNKKHEGLFDNVLLNFDNIDSETFKMEPSLVPRKLYVPFTTVTVKAFCEYLYTGQIGNKWLVAPTLMDNLLISKFFRVPLLYDLISEILFGVIGRKEAYIMKEARKLKSRYFALLREANIPVGTDYVFPLDEYEGFLDSVDDGYLDITLLKKTSKNHADSVAMSLKKKSVTSQHSHKPLEKQTEEDDGNKTSSTSEEDEVDKEYALHYLEARDNPLPTVGPRSKSVFDRHAFGGLTEDMDTEKPGVDDKSDHSMTIEELVAPDSPVPSDYVIDLIFETATLVTDMKLLLRASNLKAMTAKLEKSRVEIEVAMAGIEYQVAQMPRKPSNKSKEVQLPHLQTTPTRRATSPLPPATPTVQSPKGTITTATTSASPIPKHTQDVIHPPGPSRNSSLNNKNPPLRPTLSAQNSATKESFPLHPSASTTSLNTSKSTSSLSRIASHTSLRALSSTMPFLSSTSTTNTHPKRMERASTEAPCNDSKHLGNEGITKTRSHNLMSRVPTSTSTTHKASEKLQTSASSSVKSSTKKHSFFHLGSSHKKKERESPGASGDDAMSIVSAAPKLERSSGVNSDNVSINSDSSNKTNATTSTLRKKFGLLSGFKK